MEIERGVRQRDAWIREREREKGRGGCRDRRGRERGRRKGRGDGERDGEKTSIATIMCCHTASSFLQL